MIAVFCGVRAAVCTTACYLLYRLGNEDDDE